MHSQEIAIPIFFFICVVAIWGGFLLTRHKERMTMIDKGLTPEDVKALYQRSPFRMNPLSSLKWGIVFVAVGLAVLVGMWLRNTYFIQDGVFPGLIALFGGLGLIVFYVIAHKKIQS